MSELINCPNCNNNILSRMGTICPNCGFTVGYFNGDRRRKDYSKLFALTIFVPFFSFFTLIFSQINFYGFIVAIILTIYLAIKSCPVNFKTVFSTNFERLFFWNIWVFSNIFLSVIVFNIISKSI